MRANAKNENQAAFSALLNIFEKPSRNTHGDSRKRLWEAMNGI
jgi:thioredoxin-like negative regulator of GroEL